MTFYVSKQEIWQQGLTFSAEHICIRTGLLDVLDIESKS